MHKSYKRKNNRNKTRKKYYKVGGGDDDPIIEPIVTREISEPKTASQITEISEPITASQITEINTKITSLYDSINSILDEIPVFIGYKLIPIVLDPGMRNSYKFPANIYPNKIPLWVKRNIDSDTFLKIIGNIGSYNRNNNSYEWRTAPYTAAPYATSVLGIINLIDLKAVYSLPNVRELPLQLVSENIICYYDDEDRTIFSNLSKLNIQKLQVKYHNLFERPDPTFFNKPGLLGY